MLKDVGKKLERWLRPRGRPLLLGLVVANLGLAGSLTLAQKPVDTLRSETAVVSHQVEAEIQLLSELSLVPSEAPKPVRICRVWGPETLESAFDELVKQLRAEGAQPEVRGLERITATNYLVYIDNLESPAAAREAAEELKSNNIDSFVLPLEEGPFKVSVGLFSSQARAERLLARVGALGLDVFMKEKNRTETIYQVTAQVEDQSPLYKSSITGCEEFAQNS